ncbi:MAG: hypothetical protein GXO13_00075 [Epsilonproteobacteria bacterium]|nr:hypothetical protein [Campylobacterota bacterium]
MRDKISSLVRRSKAYGKSFEWLDNRLAMFFVGLNLKCFGRSQFTKLLTD